MSKKYKRWNKLLIENALKYRRVVILAGSRQCGKTTLAKEFIGKNVEYRTLDDASFQKIAEIDPHGFLKHKGKLMIIDEVQRVPLLLPAIKKEVDENTRPGQFLLTGSANVQSLPSIKESLAGRVKKIRLRPLSEGEIQGRIPLFLDFMFTESFDYSWDFYDRDAIIELALRGGFPEAIKLNQKERYSWHKDYLDAILERDLKEITNIYRQGAMRDLLSIAAAWSSKFMDISGICCGLSIKREAAESYLNGLEALFLIEKTPPWIKTDYDRVGKHAKLFMTDSGMMSSILDWCIDDIRFDSDKIGKLIETFIFNELSVQVDYSDHEYHLYHYRDREKREIDFIIEKRNGSLLGIEIKAGSVVNKDSFKHLKWFKDNLAKKKNFVGIVLYTGEQVFSIEDHLWAVPIGALWAKK